MDNCTLLLHMFSVDGAQLGQLTIKNPWRRCPGCNRGSPSCLLTIWFLLLWSDYILVLCVQSLGIWGVCEHKVSRIVLLFFSRKDVRFSWWNYSTQRRWKTDERNKLVIYKSCEHRYCFGLIFVWARPPSERSCFLCSSNDFALLLKSRNFGFGLERSSGVARWGWWSFLLFQTLPTLLSRVW